MSHSSSPPLLLDELYQSMILDHSRHPRHAIPLPSQESNAQAYGHNPLCGDSLACSLRITDHQISAIGMQAQGCALCMASASLLSEAVLHQSLEKVENLCEAFLQCILHKAEPDPQLGKLVIFKGVHAFPLRVKCVTMAIHTLKKAYSPFLPPPVLQPQGDDRSS